MQHEEAGLETRQHGDGCREASRWRGAAPFAAVVAIVAMLARRADGASFLPGPIEAILLLPVFVLWAKSRFGAAASDRGSGERLLAFGVLVAGIGIALATRDLISPIRAVAVLSLGCVAIDLLGVLYGRLEACIGRPRQLIGRMLWPWLGFVSAATMLLALPIATRSSIPDYRHDFWLHVLNSLHSAAGAASLTGSTAYSFAEDYSVFGQGVIVVLMQLCGIGAAIAGLSIARPFLRHVPRARTVLLLYVGLQVAAVISMYGSWRPEDAPSFASRLWWGVVYATSAGWNGGLMLQARGLGEYVGSSTVFVSITALSIIGSLGLPIILDMFLGGRVKSPSDADAGKRKGAAVGASSSQPPWRVLPMAEVIAMFLIVICTTTLVFFCETPWKPNIAWKLPEHWVPSRPVDFGENRMSIRDQMPLPQRWTLSVLSACTLRSTGMQSYPVSEGAVSWPTFGLFLLSMGVGGSVSGVASGMRVSVLLLLMICAFTRRKSWAMLDDGVRLRRRLFVALVLFIVAWTGFNLLVVKTLGATTEASRYDLAFDGVAAANNVGLTTGLSVHLTRVGRLAMIAAMLLGRALPLVFWAALAERLSQATSGAANAAAGQSSTHNT